MKESIQRFVTKNCMLLLASCVLAILAGILIGYLNYGTDLWETRGGYITGLGLGFLILLLGIRYQQ